jgi:hypothetical protein
MDGTGKSGPRIPDSGLETILDDLALEVRAGNIDALVMVVFQPGGGFKLVLHNEATPDLVDGVMALLGECLEGRQSAESMLGRIDMASATRH